MHKNKVWELFRIKIKTLEQCQWRRSSVFIVNCEHISNFFSDCWLWTGKCLQGSYWKSKHFWRQDRAYHALCCSILSVNKINKQHLNLYHHNPTGELVRNFCEGVYFRRWFCLKMMRLTFKMTCCTFFFLQILLAGRLVRSYFTRLILNCCKLLLSC